MNAGRTPNNTGQSLIELIMVLGIIGIVSLVVVSRWAGGENEIIAQLEIIKSHLRYAQSKAMSTSSNWYVHFVTSPSPGQYSLYKFGDGDAKYFPGETYNAINLETGMSLDAEKYILFDYLGRPYSDSTGTTPLVGVTEIVTSAAGNIEIQPETGFIP